MIRRGSCRVFFFFIRIYNAQCAVPVVVGYQHPFSLPLVYVAECPGQDGRWRLFYATRTKAARKDLEQTWECSPRIDKHLSPLAVTIIFSHLYLYTCLKRDPRQNKLKGMGMEISTETQVTDASCRPHLVDRYQYIGLGYVRCPPLLEIPRLGRHLRT